MRRRGVCRRVAVLQRLRKGCEAEYRRYHRHVWPELETVYRAAGFTGLGCYLDGRMLIVWMEYDARRMARKRAWLARHPVERRWQALMHTLKDPGFKTVTFREVYRLPSG